MGLAYWLANPADDWELALPVGNGRLGASVWGKVQDERITINEEGMWYGASRERKNPQAKKYFGEIREMLLQGRVEDAQFLCQMAMTGTPKYIRPYQMACDLNFLFRHRNGEVENYRRELDMKRAVVTVSYQIGETVYKREYFVSGAYQVIVMRLTAQGPDRLRFQFNINRRPFEQYSGGDGHNEIYLKGQCGDGVHYYSAAVIGEHDGKSCQIGDYLAVWDASQAVVYFDCETDYEMKDPQKICRERLKTAVNAGFAKLREKHFIDYGERFERTQLTLKTRDYEEISMETLMKRLDEEDVRRYLVCLLFAFGRYLLISSSSDCSLPANLQGIWCGSYTPRWESKYTININLEMNYWMVDSCGLSECFEPFVKLLKRIMENGKETAEKIYGCAGSVAHHNTDCYGNSDLEGLPASAYMWPMGEAWLALHLYDHYLYTLDKKFLDETALPIMKENIRFFYDYLHRDSSGKWLSGPSVSPENTYRTSDGQTASITMAPAMDNQILRELCSDYLDGMKRLEKRDDVCSLAEEILQHLPQIELTKDGRIREWYEDYEETEKGHRHLSHLFGLYPGNQISPETPELFKAAEKTLKVRLDNGGGHVGWSRAWLISMFARLQNAEKVEENIGLFLEKSIRESLFDSHPPFQIDGNFGFCAGIAEALVQRRGKDIYLLPAVPQTWKEGNIQGIRMKEGITLSIEWKENEIVWAMEAIVDQTVTLHWKGNEREIKITAGRQEKGHF